MSITMHGILRVDQVMAQLAHNHQQKVRIRARVRAKASLSNPPTTITNLPK
jgi:hypothetical protein